VHPYNDANVMAGQGTMALELLEQTVLEVRMGTLPVPVCVHCTAA
jgi:threonine dehydratase